MLSSALFIVRRLRPAVRQAALRCAGAYAARASLWNGSRALSDFGRRWLAPGPGRIPRLVRLPHALLSVHRQQLRAEAKDGYQYRCGVSCQGKPRAVHSELVAEDSGGPGMGEACELGPGGSRTCGEDAYFVVDGPDRLVLGVADGVGGWQDMGVDPSLFAWALMGHARDVARGDGRVAPADILQQAFNGVRREGKVWAGSSTACIVAVDKATAMLTCANLGDSGVMVVRRGETAWHSKEQQHYFNAPYQLAVMPEKLLAGAIVDSPADASQHSLQLERGDVVVVATDGLFDNLFDHEIVQMLQPYVSSCVEPFNAEDAVADLVACAVELARDEKRESPFSKHAQLAGYDIKGGKVDDVCAVLARVE